MYCDIVNIRGFYGQNKILTEFKHSKYVKTKNEQTIRIQI